MTRRPQNEAGLALLAVLFALTLLMLLALPFAVSMRAGRTLRIEVARGRSSARLTSPAPMRSLRTVPGSWRPIPGTTKRPPATSRLVSP